jgi:hypothetical protein
VVILSLRGRVAVGARVTVRNMRLRDNARGGARVVS